MLCRALVASTGLALLLAMLAACSGGGKTASLHPSPVPTSARGTATPTTPIAHQGESTAILDSANYYLRGMSLDQKLGQMMLIETVWTGYNTDVDNMVRGMHAGAMIVYKQNMQTTNPNGPQVLKSYLATIQAHADLPMLVTMDEEGGGVDRLGTYHFAPPLPAPQDTANTHDPQQAYDAGARAAQEMLPFGINTNLAPLADVRLTYGAVLWTRMYGTDPATVDTYAGAFLRGTQDNGVIATVKHWPGIGSVTSDPHTSLPVMNRTRDQLEATEWASFRGMLALDPGMVMVTHVLVPAVDPDMPATLSPKLVQGVLRDELGYQGVVMTDSLYMDGISARYNLGQAAVLSVEAGDDLLEGAYDTNTMRGMINALKSAIAGGQISQARIDQSVRRILALKVRFGLLPLHARGPQFAASLPLAGATTAPSPIADMPRSPIGG
jgi:beta-N-acetylhexosaminidase